MRYDIIKIQKRSLSEVPAQCLTGKRLFQSVNGKVAVFNRTILNILNNFIPPETIVCNDRDPPWFNVKIRLLIRDKTTVYKYFRQNGSDAYW